MSGPDDCGGAGRHESSSGGAQPGGGLDKVLRVVSWLTMSMTVP